MKKSKIPRQPSSSYFSKNSLLKTWILQFPLFIDKRHCCIGNITLLSYSSATTTRAIFMRGLPLLKTRQKHVRKIDRQPFRMIGVNITWDDEKFYYLPERQGANNGYSIGIATCWTTGCLNSFCIRWSRLPFNTFGVKICAEPKIVGAVFSHVLQYKTYIEK